MKASLVQHFVPEGASSSEISSRMPDIAFRQARRPVDLVHLARQTFGEKRLETELLRMFMRQARHIMASLMQDEAASAGSARAPVADLLHTLVGSARVIGAFEVATLSESIEQRLRAEGAGASCGLSDAERGDLSIAVGAACGFIVTVLGSP